ncbi:MAG: hypothetical protein PHC28_05875 [Flavobacterium sp.]|uniref:hypothetical protein n=1 Tax=Flavobacterium sp. TaxID=239 RepID=UPI00260424E2|nr:hypothetical protein [Flavobacterium sp.]MDD5149997.1 hypothetical protein [Flavobacterium sp.]
MSKHKIVAIKSRLWDNILRFDGFILEDIDGEVNPFMTGEFHVPELTALIANKHYDFTKEYFKAEISWAESMIGKYLVCDSILYKAYATNGNVTFTEEGN